MKHVVNCHADSSRVEIAIKQGLVVGDPIATCMSIPTVKKAQELGYVGIWDPGQEETAVTGYDATRSGVLGDGQDVQVDPSRDTQDANSGGVRQRARGKRRHR